MELELLTLAGTLLPRNALHTDAEQSRQVSFYVTEQRSGFFGMETIVKRKTATLLDWDAEYVMVLTDLPLVTPVVVSASAELYDDCVVLVTDEKTK